MELLERYLDAIAVELPKEKQPDIIRELRANLLDLVDAAREDKGSELTEAELGQLLQQHGHPVDVAQRYAPDLPLVAAEDMPLYRTVLWHSAAVVAVLVLLKSLGLLVQLDSFNPVTLIISLIGGFIEQFSTVLLVVTAIFYGAAHAGWTEQWRQRRFEIKDLPRFPQARIRLSDTITDLTSAAFLLLLLWTPLWMSAEAQANLPVQLAEGSEFWRYTLTGLALASTFFSLYRLTQLSWQRWSKLWYAIEHLLFALVFAGMSQQDGLLQRTVAKGDAFERLWLAADRSVSLVFMVTALVLIGLAILEFKRWHKL